jgi:hypothetical protein
MKELLNLNQYERINEISVILTNKMNMIPKKFRLISLPWSDELNTIYSIEGLLSLSIYLGSLDKTPEYIINPSTNRKVLLSNKIGQELLDGYSESIYKIIGNKKQIGGVAGIAKMAGPLMGKLGGLKGTMPKMGGLMPGAGGDAAGEGGEGGEGGGESDIMKKIFPFPCKPKEKNIDPRGEGVRIKLLLGSIKFNSTMTRCSKLINMINEHLEKN